METISSSLATIDLPNGWQIYIPLGIIGIIRWTSWLIRRIPAAFYRPVVNKHRESLGIVVPVYNEDPAILAHAIESWLANPGVDQIVLVVDVTDRKSLEVAARYPVETRVTDVPGKRDALRVGWNVCTTSLVALVDSDTIWASDVARKVCMPFADPAVGGVATRQNVYNPDSFFERIADMYLDYRYFDENASQSVVGQALSCISGRTAVYRRQLLLEIEEEFMDETFMGIQCMSGDDKRLTTLILERGWSTVLQRNARVWSTFPARWRIFFKQRLRWARNTWRSDLRALGHRWAWRHKFLAWTMIDKIVSCFTILLAPIFMTIAVIKQDWNFVVLLAAWWWLSRSIKMLPHLRRRPSSFFLIPPYVLLTFVMALVKIGALLTIRKQRWLTRPVAVVGNQIVRTGTAGDSDPVGAQA